MGEFRTARHVSLLECRLATSWRPSRASLRRAAGTAAAAAAAALVLAGCSTGFEVQSGPADMQSSALPFSYRAPAGSSALHDRQASTTTSAQPDAVQVAVEATRLFCRPRLRQTRWIADLDRVLTLDAASVYATVDPARVQCSRVELPARAVEGDGYTQLVMVPTDGSVYRVTLSKSSLSQPWLVFRISPAPPR
jgi:hypothetical protein